jgi:caffeoyl-CoA O-methyltransferase
MDFLPKDIQHYVAMHTSPEPELLAKLNRHTHVQVLQPRMLSGHVQGRFLAMLAHIIKPQFVLEIGTYTGYSALCMAEGLAPSGKLLTIEVNEELQGTIQAFFDQSPYAQQIQLTIGDAQQIIPTITNKIDLAFIDADKKNYQKYFELIIPKMQKSGIIIADNVLWSGKVVQTDKIDKDTQALIDFNHNIQQDPRVQNMLLPLRDGLMIVRVL